MSLPSRLRRLLAATRFAACIALAAALGGVAESADGHLLDQRFESGDVAIVPMDLQTVDLSLAFDLNARSVTGQATLSFSMPADGRPSFRMDAEPHDVLLDGAPAAVTRTRTPRRGTTVRVVGAELASGSRHTLELAYRLPARAAMTAGGGLDFFTLMNDLQPRGRYFEAYGPTNVEADSYEMTLGVRVFGADETPRVFANGRVERTDADTPTWRIVFPPWYTTSSFFVHVTNAPLHVLEDSVSGAERDIPVTVYSRSLARAETAMALLPAAFAELEATWGPYLHDSFTAYIVGRGGMEYCGATATSIPALEHELTHMWFARGVMPSTGRDGWIDEAIASWRDFGYPRALPDPRRRRTDMAGFSPFEPFTPRNVYLDGSALLAEIDGLVAAGIGDGGLRPVLARWFAEANATSVSTEDFLSFLERDTGLDLAPLFRRYVTDDASGDRSHGAPPRRMR